LVLAILDWLSPEKDADGKYIVSDLVAGEAKAALAQAYKDAGQEELL